MKELKNRFLLNIHSSEFLKKITSPGTRREGLIPLIPEGTNFKSTTFAYLFWISTLYVIIGLVLVLLLKSDNITLESSGVIIISLFILTTLSDADKLHLSLNNNEKTEFNKMKKDFGRLKVLLCLIVLMYFIQYSITNTPIFSIENSGLLGLFKIVVIMSSTFFIIVFYTNFVKLVTFIIRDEVGTIRDPEEIEEEHFYLGLY